MFNNFHFGVAGSFNPSETLSLDLALVHDFQTGGTFTSNRMPWGIVGNLRWNPRSFPMFFGISGNFERTLDVPDPYGGSLYTGLSLDQLTRSSGSSGSPRSQGPMISGSLLWEGVIAKNWNNPAVNTGQINPGLSQFFIPASNTRYFSEILSATSLGWFGQAKYNLTHVWTLLYRFDFLALDINRYDENYTRHGFGFEAYLNSNLIWQTRYEFAAAPSFISTTGSSTLATQNDIFTMLRFWI